MNMSFAVKQMFAGKTFGVPAKRTGRAMLVGAAFLVGSLSGIQSASVGAQVPVAFTGHPVATSMRTGDSLTNHELRIELIERKLALTDDAPVAPDTSDHGPVAFSVQGELNFCTRCVTVA